jgi:hypothetical protein
MVDEIKGTNQKKRGQEAVGLARQRAMNKQSPKKGLAAPATKQLL